MLAKNLKNIFRILFVNFGGFLIVIFIFELLFRNLSFISADFYSSVQLTLNPPPKSHFLNQTQVFEKYGVDLLNVPKKYQTLFSSKLIELKNASRGENAEYTSALIFQKNRGDQSEKTFKTLLTAAPPHENEIIYMAEYKFDKHKRRVVENQISTKKYSNFYLALGDSFTFGEGVSTGFDYPSQLAAKINSNWRVYNLAIPGHGPNDLLRDLEIHNDYLNGINEKSGIAVWLFIPDHLERFFCKTQCSKSKNSKYFLSKPEYLLENDDLKFQGYFYNREAKKGTLQNLLSYSEIYQAVSKSAYTDSELQMLTRALTQIEKKIKAKLNLKKLYVLFIHNFQQKDQFTKMLVSENIGILDFTDILFSNYPNSFIPVDGHPSSNFYWNLTELIKSSTALKN